MQINEDEFNSRKYFGIQTSVDLYGCNEKIKDANAIKEYVHELCRLIKMKMFGDTDVVHFGDDPKVTGYSMVQLIETSLISGHFAESSDSAYIDIFSCKYYDPEIVVRFSKDYFDAEKAEKNVLIRK